MKIIRYLFWPNASYEGVRPIKIWLLRFMFLLISAMMAPDAWQTLASNHAPWENHRAMSLCVWAAYGTLSVIGIFRPLKMLPIFLFMIFYKSLWLAVVALPLWRAGTLADSPAWELANIFLPAPFLVVIVPWRYVWTQYLRPNVGAGMNSQAS